MIAILVSIIITISIICIVSYFIEDEEEIDDSIIKNSSDIDIYLKKSIEELKNIENKYSLSYLSKYAAKMNFRNNYNKETIDSLTKYKYDTTINNIAKNYKYILINKLNHDYKTKQYLLKYFINDIIE